MARKLKVFRTAIGFHDAYVAATSRKAALAAWGSDADLFARGMAEEVTDPERSAEPLTRPGEVIRVVRGSAAEHLAALPADKPRKETSTKPDRAKAEKRPPRPTRTAVDAAQALLAEAERDFADRSDALRRQEAALAAERRRLDRERTEALERLRREVDDAECHYREAVTAWQR